MLLGLLSNIFTPSQVAQSLRENFGYAVTSFVIVKWDNLILRKSRLKDGGKLHRRAYSLSDVTLFNAIATMRNLGYSIPQIQKIFALDLRNEAAGKECMAFINTVKDKIARQKKGLDSYDDFLEALRNRNQSLHGTPSSSNFKRKRPRHPCQPEPGTRPKPKILLVLKPATSEQIAQSKSQVTGVKGKHLFKPTTPKQIAQRKDQS